MSTMNISLPETLRSFVDSQVSDGDYTSSSEYVRELLRKEQDRVRLREMLLDGAASPLSENVWNAEYFEKMRQSVEAKKK
ncbi:MAG: type II toxin-antitoxin system ParD family antitoxin [Pyrinomonadaceae bacterium]